MKYRKKFSSVFLLWALLLPMVLHTSESQSVPKNAWIQVSSPNDSIQTFLDDQYIGYTPIKNFSITVGTHKLMAKIHNAPTWQTHIWEKEFRIAANDTLKFSITPHRQLYINSVPFGAKILLKSDTLGTTPAFIALPDSTKGFLVLRKKGFLDYIIKLQNKETNFFDIPLQLNQSSEEERIQFSIKMKHKQRRRKFLTYSMLGLSALSGLSTIYLRQEADERYEKYLNSGHPTEMDKLYDQTRQLDQFAAITYGVFQVSFVTSFYFLFFRK